MDLIKIDTDNISVAKNYLASQGRLQEFENKKVDASQWSAVILFANQVISQQNSQQNNNNQ